MTSPTPGPQTGFFDAPADTPRSYDEHDTMVNTDVKNHTDVAPATSPVRHGVPQSPGVAAAATLTAERNARNAASARPQTPRQGGTYPDSPNLQVNTGGLVSPNGVVPVT